MPNHDDPKLLDAGCDVVIRFKGHGSYKGADAALAALARRTPGSSRAQCRAIFDLFCRVYDRAVEAIRRHRIERPEKASRFAKIEDIDSAACMRDLETIEPGLATQQKQAILNWVIDWHYLR
jgi:hypothetical protein